MSPVSVCELLVGGMTCTACTGAVHGALTKKPGVLRANVDILRETARVAYHSDIIAPEELCGVIQSLGFEAEILQIFAPSDPSSDDSRTTADWTDPSIGVQKSELGGPLPPQQAISADPEDRQTAALPLAFQKTTAGNYDYSDLVNKSKATIRLAIHESEGLSAESACSSLESINGVLSCAVTPINGFNVNGAKQLIVTYKPNVVGVRDLFIKLMRRGFNPSLLAEDPLETQARIVHNLCRLVFSMIWGPQ
ncbi:Copper-transporting ATPase, related [Eimeria tenella]|uniref:Copper-transporting ATPase, related n=1 Tax=Eimeria tenella TaxID=5802 RepID=U6KJY8_EIMTE|nr:Copper-transporting ATPase, related [Eimeria tenella]CDJ38244.1 Copper-transporting ATPase, related [Eimeria tenella]|eukprot:XP_013229082.1 Copper-transporting ATPase, related [Eimeria tenella]